MSKHEGLSKFISLILRHKPEAASIVLDEHGWAKVGDLLRGISDTGKVITMTILEEIVESDEKGRYSFNEDKTLIRANQGHSVEVDVELNEAIPPERLYHGTTDKFLGGIKSSGLESKSRLYVHLSKDKETAVSVGTRHGKPVVLEIKAKEMYEAGYKFYLSVNGVWLVKSVPVEFILF